jgi:hypothetical protein
VLGVGFTLEPELVFFHLDSMEEMVLLVFDLLNIVVSSYKRRLEM